MRHRIFSAISLLTLASCGAPVEDQSAMRSRLSNAGAVTGVIDGVAWESDHLLIHGWACQQSVQSSISVHVYVGGAAGTGAILGGYVANQSREMAVSLACSTSGIAHGFTIAIPRVQLSTHEGKAIFVHGISTTNGANLLLNRSGEFSVPDPLPAMVARLSDRVRGLAPGADLNIAAGETVMIDSSIDVGVITVGGTLRCPSTGDFTVSTAGIAVVGAGATLECGSETARFDGRLTIALKPGRSITHAGERALAVADGAALRLFGKQKNHRWVRLRAAVAAGSNTIELDAPVDWSADETVVLGPTGFNFREAEERTIAGISADRRTITVRAPFTYAHAAFQQTYTRAGRSWTLDQRPEVANLSRNIVVTAAGDAAALDAARVGAHIMVMPGGSAQVDGVELTRMGQLGTLARYPFHWHLVGDANGQFIKNSSIHHTYQRCVTIHGTNRARVENNVCFDHIGHGFFFEQGNEVDNIVIANLGMLSRRAPADRGLLVSDMASTDQARFSAPATFWIANPRNTITDNVASGSEGTGFWMAFNQALECSTNNSCLTVTDDLRATHPPNVFPARESTTAFARNIAHAAEVGITWDGAEDGPLYDTFRAQHAEIGDPLPGLGARNRNARATTSTHYYHRPGPENTPSFEDLVVFKNAASGVYFRGEPARFPGLIAADNGYSLFFAYNQSVTDGLVVGASAAITAQDLAYVSSLPGAVRLNSFQGARIYDGPFELTRVHFADFRSQTTAGRTIRAWPFVNIGGANRLINRVSGASFDDASIPQRFALAGETENFAQLGWYETPWTTAVRDVDGSLSGNGGRIIVPNHPMNIAPDCVALANNIGDGYACSYDWGVLAFFDSGFAAPYDANHFPFTVERIDETSGAVVSPGAPALSALQNKTGLIIGSRYRYRLGSPIAPLALRARWQSETGAVTPLIEIPGIPNCRPSGAALLSLSELRGGRAGYNVTGATLYFRLAPGITEFVCN